MPQHFQVQLHGAQRRTLAAAQGLKVQLIAHISRPLGSRAGICCIDHLLRGIDRFRDVADLRQHLAPFYSHTGRPSVDPELMVRMLKLVA